MTRRDNGLPGGDWRQVVEVEPPIADALLAALADEGIAAYAEPSTGASGGMNIESAPHPGAKDHVYVAADEVDRASGLVDHVLGALRGSRAEPATAGEAEPAEAQPSEDDVWAGIVAAYAAPPAQPAGRPGETGADRPAPSAAAEDSPAAAPGPTASGFEDIRAELEERRRERPAPPDPLDDPTEHFVPPPPPPIPRGTAITQAAWVGVLGGPLFLVLATLLQWDPGGLTGLLAVLAFVGGFITLVVHRGDDPPDEDDNGAVV